jgi:integrase
MKRRENGAGTTYQLPSGKWRSEVRVTVGGRSERVKATGDTATAAKKARDEKVAALRARSTIVSSDATVRRWVEQWVATADVRETTKETRRQVLAGLLDAIGERKLQALTADDVRNALDRMQREEYGSRTIQMAYEALSTALNVAAREDRIAFNPCAKVAKPKHVKRAYHAPDAEESRRLIEAARPGRERTLVTLALELGLRVGEALALRWCDVDFDDAVLSVSATLSDRGERVDPKTDTSTRRLAIPSWSFALLRELRASERSLDESFVFHTDSGKPLNRHNARRDLHRVCDRAGLPRVRVHALRSTSLSLRLANGAAYEDVARVAGHKNSRMLVSVYARPMQGDRRMADVIDSVWKNGPQMAPKWVSNVVPTTKRAKKKPAEAGLDVVEVRRLELLTPYMRSKKRRLYTRADSPEIH